MCVCVNWNISIWLLYNIKKTYYTHLLQGWMSHPHKSMSQLNFTSTTLLFMGRLVVSVQCTLCTVYTDQLTLATSVKYTLTTVYCQCTAYSVQCIVYTVQCVQCTVYTDQLTLSTSVKYTLATVYCQCTAYIVHVCNTVQSFRYVMWDLKYPHTSKYITWLYLTHVIMAAGIRASVSGESWWCCIVITIDHSGQAVWKKR